MTDTRPQSDSTPHGAAGLPEDDGPKVLLTRMSFSNGLGGEHKRAVMTNVVVVLVHYAIHPAPFKAAAHV